MHLMWEVFSGLYIYQPITEPAKQPMGDHVSYPTDSPNATRLGLCCSLGLSGTIYHYLNQCLLTDKRTPRNVSEISIKTQQLSLKNNLKLSEAKWLPFCLVLEYLTYLVHALRSWFFTTVCSNYITEAMIGKKMQCCCSSLIGSQIVVRLVVRSHIKHEWAPEKWLTFCRRHFQIQIYFLQKNMCLILKFYRLSRIDVHQSGADLEPNKCEFYVPAGRCDEKSIFFMFCTHLTLFCDLLRCASVNWDHNVLLSIDIIWSHRSVT